MIGAGLPSIQVTPHAATGGVWIALAVVVAMLFVFVASILVSAHRMKRVDAGASAFEPKAGTSSDRRAA